MSSYFSGRVASASKWVLWEFQTAQVKPGLNAILPMPLEDPAIVPLPPGMATGPGITILSILESDLRFSANATQLRHVIRRPQITAEDIAEARRGGFP
jgi:hypothetical protein